MKAKIFVTLKKGVLDPQGEAVLKTLQSLDFKTVQQVRQGKYFDITLNQTPKEAAQKEIKDMCFRLLANTVIEDFNFEIIEDSA